MSVAMQWHDLAELPSRDRLQDILYCARCDRRFVYDHRYNSVPANGCTSYVYNGSPGFLDMMMGCWPKQGANDCAAGR